MNYKSLFAIFLVALLVASSFVEASRGSGRGMGGWRGRGGYGWGGRGGYGWGGRGRGGYGWGGRGGYGWRGRWGPYSGRRFYGPFW